LLVPSSNTTMEPELYAMAPTGVTIHTARMHLREVTPSGLEEMAGEATRGALLLGTAGVDVLVYGCTSGSLLKGPAWERELAQRLVEAAGAPAYTTAGAVVEALRALGAEAVSVFTPYVDSINELERRFLEAMGFQVASIKGLGLRDNRRIGETPPEAVVGLVESAPLEADAVFISCTNLPSIGLIEPLEERLGVPVVTSNQASMWIALKGGDTPPVEGYGCLFKHG